MSPTVFQFGKYRFFFFSREEPRRHVHVRSPDGEAKFWLEPEVELAINHGLSQKELREWKRLWRKRQMKYASIGTSTSGPEVTDISPFGIWILYRGKEYLLDYDEFPWFLNAPIQKVFSVTEEGPEHLRWPELDIDLSLDSIKYPGAFPLVYEPPGTYRQAGEGTAGSRAE